LQRRDALIDLIEDFVLFVIFIIDHICMSSLRCVS